MLILDESPRSHGPLQLLNCYTTRRTHHLFKTNFPSTSSCPHSNDLMTGIHSTVLDESLACLLLTEQSVVTSYTHLSPGRASGEHPITSMSHWVVLLERFSFSLWCLTTGEFLPVRKAIPYPKSRLPGGSLSSWWGLPRPFTLLSPVLIL